MPRVIVFNKPYGVLSQFTDENGHPGLSGFIQQPGYYAAGRLDRDSEGCLVLTDLGQVQHLLASPTANKVKVYWVQVEGIPNDADLERLRKGVELKDGPCKPAGCYAMPEPEVLWPRQPAVRERKSVPDSWLQLQLSEGRNRQVRRMTAAIGFPTLRLVRFSIGPFDIQGLQPGQWKWAELPPDYLVKREARANHRGAGNKPNAFKSRVKRLGK